jgi:hypothetical protein
MQKTEIASAPMGVNHGGGGRIPPEFAVGRTLIQVVPPRFLSFFKISSARHGFVLPDFNPDLRHCPHL